MESTLRTFVVVIVAAAAGAGGCAHAWNAPEGQREARGSLRLAAGDARLLVTGPASQVHANVSDGRPVALFLANVVNGDDADCAVAAARATGVASAPTRRLQVPAGQVLCAVSPAAVPSSAPAELLWHARREPVSNPVALR